MFKEFVAKGGLQPGKIVPFGRPLAGTMEPGAALDAEYFPRVLPLTHLNATPDEFAGLHC
jgi:hypothetical protein